MPSCSLLRMFGYYHCTTTTTTNNSNNHNLRKNVKCYSNIERCVAFKIKLYKSHLLGWFMFS